MTDTDLDAMCTAAMVRINYFINRSSAQSLRRMKEKWDSQLTLQDNDSDGLQPSNESGQQWMGKPDGNAFVIAEK